jgi:hypothetical protein
MATAATAKQVKVKQTKPEAVEDSLEGVYEELVKILQRHAPPFRSDVPCMAVGKRSFQLTVPKPVAIPGAYGGKPVDLQMAAAMLQHGAAKKKLSPALLKLLKGKTCFHVKNLDDGLRKDIEAALEMSTKVYRERGWL